MEIPLIMLSGGLLLYAGYLRLQLHISRRIISALQETTVTAEAARPFDPRPALAGLGLLILIAGAALNWSR
ncbi:MAG: hypothetical protein KA764_18045 [Anaerolineales bacterium]|nr:hypothetical protein [Anaerolineales bacterium]